MGTVGEILSGTNNFVVTLAVGSEAVSFPNSSPTDPEFAGLNYSVVTTPDTVFESLRGAAVALPIGEPEALSLLAFGILALGLLRRQTRC
jgi:hypothetical protein